MDNSKGLLYQNRKIKRFRHISIIRLLKVTFLLFFSLSTVLFFLNFYTPWVLQRTYNSKNEALEKNWTANPWPIIKTIFPKIFFNNYAAIINILFAEEEIEKKSLIPAVKIFIKNNGLDELDIKNFQYQLGDFDKKQRVSGYFQEKNGRLIPIKLNMRGTMSDHHQAWKPSLRLRFKKNNLQKGFKNHTLVAPNDGIGFSNWLSNQLGAHWNMLGIGEHFVSLFINDKYFGVYNRLWRLDESLLINSNRLPGPFFRLEPQVKRLFYMGNFHNWNEPEGWQPIGVTNIEAKNILTPPLMIATAINNWTISQGKKKLFKNLINLNEWIDNDRFAKFHALMTHSGENHVDTQHNNAFWLDQSSGKLIPILVDLQGYSRNIGDWENLHRPIIKRGSAFVDAWFKHPSNYLNYINQLWEILTTFGSSKSVEKIILQEYKRVRINLLSDTFFSLAGNPREFFPVTQIDNLVEHLLEFVKKRNEWLINELISDEVSVIEKQNNHFKLFIDGYSGVNGQRLDGKNFYINGAKKPINKFFFLPHPNLLVNQIEEFPPAYGIYEVSGRPEDYIFSHRLNNQKTNLKTFKYKDYLKILEIAKGFDQSSIPINDTKPIQLGPGEVIFNQSIESDKKQPIKILPGTTIKLGPKVSLIFKGPLTIGGTKNQPVKIKPLVPGNPFGVVAIIGQETEGSSIKYLEMEGGSIGNRFNLKFTGMLSIHDCPNVEISKSIFRRNFLGDDAVHIVRSKATILESVFENSYSDALDWDKVDGLIKNNYFLNPGNDGIDLSMGKINITGNRFQKCGDKCISAGEGTKTQVTDTEIRDCSIDIAIKDRSNVNLKDGVINGCNIALNVFRKKWRWGKGGIANIQNTRFLNSIRTDILGDKLSQINFLGPKPKNLKVEGKVKIEPTLN